MTMIPDEQLRDVRIRTRLVLGVAVMVVGLVLALDSLGLLDADRVLRFWPLVLVAIGLTKLLSGYPGPAVFWIGAGAGLQLHVLGYLPSATVWAVLLFLLGARITWRALRGPDAYAYIPWRTFRGPVARGVPSSDSLDMVAVFGSAKNASTSADFRGGSAVAMLGGCEIDLRQATIAEGHEAVIDAFAFWGGIEIRVPEDWEVVNRGSAFLGAFENKARARPGAGKRLVVTGTVVMGGVEVKN
jgi:predicted membrane protein